MITRRRRYSAEEGGSALILALMFAVIFSVLVTAVITFADVGLKSSKGFRAKRITSTGPEATIEAAILDRANGGACDDENLTPLGIDDPSTGDVDEALLPVGGRSLVARCQNLGVEPNSGAGSSNKPRTALLALGAEATEGIVNGGPANIRVRGDVFSRSQIDGGNGLVVEGGVSSLQPNGLDPLNPCPGVSTDTNPSTPTECGGTPPADPVDSRDPDFTKSITAVPVRRVVDAPTLCAAAIEGWLVPLSPGYYDDADDLSLLTADGGDCDDKVIWMQPGTYYFDFGFKGGSTTWLITDPDVNVIAGEPKGFDPLVPPDARPALAVPGSCLTTGDADHSDGVEVIAGAESRIDVVDGRMEFCAPPRPTEQQIAVYGIDKRKLTHSLEPTAVVESSGFMDPQRTFVAGELAEASARADLTPTDPGPATLTLGTFRQTIPTGSFIDSAVLRVRHEETGNVGTLTLAADGCSGSLTLNDQPTLTEDTFDLRDDCGFDSPSDFTDLTVTYEFNPSIGGTATALVDAITIDVQYREPLTRKPTQATVGGAGFNPVESAFEIGERPEALATANLTAGTPTASITFAGFADPPLPAGAQIDSAVLRVRHQDGVDVTGQITTTTNFLGCAAFAPFANQPVLTTESPAPDLQACGLDTAEKLAGLSVTYTATLGGALADADALLDGVWLELTYRPVLTATAATAASSGTVNFDAPTGDGIVIDGTTTDADLAGAGSTGILTLDTWASGIPSGSILDSAELLVAHREDILTDLGGAAIDAKVTPTFTGSNSCDSPTGIALTNSPTTLTTITLDLTACGLDELADLAGFSAEYEAAFSGSGTGTVRVDGMALRLLYRPPVTFTEPTPTTVRSPTTVSASTTFTNTGDALTINGTSSEANLVDNLVDPDVLSASITLTGHATPALTAGSRIDEVTLRVAHSEGPPAGQGNVAASVTPTFTGINDCSGGVTGFTSSDTLANTSINLKDDCGLDQPEDLAGFSVTYAATLDAGAGNNRTIQVDGMVLEIVFTPPSMRPLSGCHASTPYPATGGSCALLKSSINPTPTPGAPTARLVVNGTIYVPSGAIDLAMDQVESGVITRGAVARHIGLDIRPETGNDRPTIGIPPESVLFTAYPDGRHRPLEPTLGPPAVGEFSLEPGGDPRFAPRPVDPLDPLRLLRADLDNTNPGTTDNASVTLASFAHDTMAPTSPVDGAVLRIRHSGDPTVTEISVTIAGLPDAACNGTRTLPAILPTTSGTFSIDLTACGITTAADLAGLSVTYDVALDPTLPPGATGIATLDGIVLDVYSRPLLRAEVSFERGRANVEGWSVLS